MSARFSGEQISAIRNRVPIRKVIQELLELPNKEQEGFMRFLCPCCGEFRTSVHRTENIGRCFLCEKNFNPIDLVMADRKLGFIQTVNLLSQYL